MQTVAATQHAVRTTGLPFTAIPSAVASARPATMAAAVSLGSPPAPARRSPSVAGGGVTIP